MSSAGALPQSVRPLRASLEDLDDSIAHRATLVAEARHIASNDDVRPQVLQEATRLAHGGSGDVKTEWFEDLFGKSLEKYAQVQNDMDAEIARQDTLLEQIRVSGQDPGCWFAHLMVGTKQRFPCRTQRRSSGQGS